MFKFVLRAVYKPYCKQNVDHFVSGCFENDENVDVDLPMRMPGIIAPKPPFNFGKSEKLSKSLTGKVYKRCELGTKFS